MDTKIETTETVEPPVRKCEIEKVLGKTINALLMATPENKQVRAQCLNLLHKEIPPELLEYGAIKDWVEFNIEPKTVSPIGHKTAFRVGVGRSYTETGTACYTQPYLGNGIMEINEAYILEQIGSAMYDGASFDTLVERIEEKIKSDAEDEIECEGDEIEYSDHEAHDTYDHGTEISSNVSHLVREWMENNDRDRLKTLDDN